MLQRSLGNTESECGHLKDMCEKSQDELKHLAEKYQDQLKEVQELQDKLKVSHQLRDQGPVPQSDLSYDDCKPKLRLRSS